MQNISIAFTISTKMPVGRTFVQEDTEHLALTPEVGAGGRSHRDIWRASSRRVAHFNLHQGP